MLTLAEGVCVCLYSHKASIGSGWQRVSYYIKSNPNMLHTPAKISLSPPDYHSATAFLPPSIFKVNGTCRMWWSQRDQQLCVHQRLHTSVNVCASEGLFGNCLWSVTFCLYLCVSVCSFTLLAPPVFHHCPKWNFLFQISARSWIMLLLFSSLLSSPLLISDYGVPPTGMITHRK